MRGGRVITGIALIVFACLLAPGGALACSCAPTPPREALARADAAIVGRLLKVEPRGPTRAAYRYRVLRVYRGGEEVAVGSTLTVLSGRGSASCALPIRLRRRYGLFLTGEQGRWASGLCGVISPRRLGAAAREPAARPVSGGGSCAS